MLRHPRHRPPRTWRRASQATSAVLLVVATAWGVQLGVAAPGTSPVDPPAQTAALDPTQEGAQVAAQVVDSPVSATGPLDGHGGGRHGRG